MQIGSAPATHWNHWRRRYTRPEHITSIGLEAVKLLRDPKKARNHLNTSREIQREMKRRTGFAGGNAELGHAVREELLALGYSPTVAEFAANLCAIAGSYNFQGNRRISQLMKRSLRTIQRCRALLEADGLLRSHIVEAGDLLDGMKAPATRTHVVRDVSAMQRLANNRSAERRKPHTRGKKHAKPAPAPKAEPVEPVTAEQLDAVAAGAPDYLRDIISDVAQSKRRNGAGRSRSVAETPKPKREPSAWVPDLTSHRGRISAAELDQHLARMEQRRPVTEETAPTDEELDALDLELQRASEQGGERPADKPPPLH